jgi:hypothetical protein
LPTLTAYLPGHSQPPRAVISINTPPDNH